MKTNTPHPHVAKTPGVCGGEPVVSGTRVPVRIVADCGRRGLTAEQIRAAYPHLELAQILDALAYAEEHAGEIQSHRERHRLAQTTAPVR